MNRVTDAINSLDLKTLEYKCFEFLNNKCFYRQYDLQNQDNYFLNLKNNLSLLESLFSPVFRFNLDSLSFLDVTFTTRKGLDRVSINNAGEIFYLRGEIYASTEGCGCGKKDDSSISDFVKQVTCSKFDKDLQLVESQFFNIKDRDKKVWKRVSTDEIVSEVYQVADKGIQKEIASLYTQGLIEDIIQEKIIIMEYGWENSRPFISLVLHPNQTS
jgi:hypothetical protein